MRPFVGTLPQKKQCCSFWFVFNPPNKGGGVQRKLPPISSLPPETQSHVSLKTPQKQGGAPISKKEKTTFATPFLGLPRTCARCTMPSKVWCKSSGSPWTWNRRAVLLREAERPELWALVRLRFPDHLPKTICFDFSIFLPCWF